MVCYDAWVLAQACLPARLLDQFLFKESLYPTPGTRRSPKMLRRSLATMRPLAGSNRLPSRAAHTLISVNTTPSNVCVVKLRDPKRFNGECC